MEAIFLRVNGFCYPIVTLAGRKRSGVQQSMGSAIMSAIIGFMVQNRKLKF